MADKYSTTVTCERYFRINSAEPVNPEDLEVSLNYNGNDNENNSNSSKSLATPKLLVMTILWGYYQAYEQGLLREDAPAPWEEFRDDKWIEFLKCINKDEDCSAWITNPQEAKEHIIEIYNDIE